MKIGFIISVFNKWDDLLLHLEVFKYYPFEHTIIIVHMMPIPSIWQQELSKYHTVQIHGYGHYIGPLLSAVSGVRKAHELGCEYSLFNNADDITYHASFVENNFKLMKEKGYLCGGYNWLNVGKYHDITLNHFYTHTSSFYATANDAEDYFKRSQPGFLCEYKMPRWVKKTCHNLEKEFYRIPGREQEPGIGWERKDIYGAFHSKGLQIPVGFWERLENNNRYFNLEWQMIGSHDVASRLIYWRKIRNLVPYGKKIEKDYHFSRFLDAARNNKPWNLPGKEDDLKPIPSDKKPKLISRKIF